MKKVLYVLHQKTSVAGDIGNKFKERGYLEEIIRPPLGDKLPEDLSKYSAIIIFGGPMSVNDEDQFIKDEINWMEKVINSKIPFLGICLGAQILAKYLGCDVVKNENDLAEIGFYQIKPVGEGDNIFKNKITILYKSYLFFFIILLFQIFLGIVTLLSGLSIYLASLHQISSILLIIFTLRLHYKSL